MIDIVMKKPNGTVFTTSLLIAERFNKRHKTVLRKIQQLPQDDFAQRNFAPSDYLDDSGKSNLMYEITRDGFSYIAMSFTGKEAHKWKVQFIDAFNRVYSACYRLISY